MTANQSRLLGVALLLAAVSAATWLSRADEPPDRGAGLSEAQQALARKQQLEQEYERLGVRLAAGAFVLNSKRISDSEVVETVVIPEARATELDTRCVIYKNSELKTSSITCTGAFFGRPSPAS